MISSIGSAIIDWCHAIVLEPYAEGAERINRCFQGVDFHQIDRPTLSWDERVIALLTGIALMLPIINTVIWIVMRTFFNAEILSKPLEAPPFDPWPEAIEASARRMEPQIHTIRPPEGTAPLSTRQWQMDEEIADDHVIANYEIKSYPKLHIFNRASPGESSAAIYDDKWNLQSLHFKSERFSCDVIAQKSDDIITIKGIQNGQFLDKLLSIPNPSRPWIQQVNVGLQTFLQTDAQELLFYGIHPKEMTLTECYAVKEGTEDLPGYGPVTKVVSGMDGNWLYRKAAKLGTALYHPQDHNLLSLDYRLGVFVWGKATLINPAAQNTASA